MKPNKERFIKDAKAEYIKRVNSPAYKKQVKRNIELFERYNLYFCGENINHQDIRDAANYFAEDIKNPITKPNQIISEKPNILTSSGNTKNDILR